jgi:ABC-2 type transport system ATP-binding protein
VTPGRRIVSPPADADGPGIQLHDVSRSFGDHVAVAGVDLCVREGESFTLPGADGAGRKTTVKVPCWRV